MCLHPKIDKLENEVKELYTHLNTDLIDNCDYIEESDIKEVVITKSDLSIVQWNIRGVLSKEADLIKLLNFSNKRKLDIIVLVETWLTKTSEKNSK